MKFDDYQSKRGKGCIYNGQAESGKTTKLGEMVQQLSKILRPNSSFLYQLSCRECGKDVNWYNVGWCCWWRIWRTWWKKVIYRCFTFVRYFCEWNGRDISRLKDKVIPIEEFSMALNKWIALIYEAFTLYGNKIFMFGDPSQCEPVGGGSQVH